jgi:hypothetical protein
MTNLGVHTLRKQPLNFAVSAILVALSLFAQPALAERPAHAGPPEGAGVPAHLREAFANRFENTERVQKAIDAQLRHSNSLITTPGVIATAVGWNEDDTPVVKLYLENSASSAGLPESLDGIPVVIERTGKVYALGFDCEQTDTCEPGYTGEATAVSEPVSQRQWHERPVPIGVSISRSSGAEAGTLACRVSNGCHVYALSNAHVLVGQSFSSSIGSNTLQPGQFDQGINPDDAIAKLYDYVPIVFSTNPGTTNNRVDAAISKTTTSQVGYTTRSDGYGTPRTQPLAPTAGLSVQKYGRTSGQTYGYIEAVNAMINVAYGSKTALFKGQMIIRKNGGGSFSTGGDSGSLVVASGGSNDRRPVGLIFAGGIDGNNDPISVANDISEVLTQLGVQIDGAP